MIDINDTFETSLENVTAKVNNFKNSIKEVSSLPPASVTMRTNACKFGENLTR